jgi:C-terminal processing protease CtpA/Prc
MNIKSTASLISLSLFMTMQALASEQYEYKLLKQVRSSITIPEYSLEERKRVFDQVKMVVNELYVHRDLKKKNFNVDPAQALKEIESKLPSLPIIDFHKKISSIFTSFRDRHTLYYLPRPFACHMTFLPVVFRDVLGDNGQPEFAVQLVDTNESINEQLEKPLRVKKGDVLINYDGMSAEDAINKQISEAPGPNPSASRRQAMIRLRIREQSLDFLPAKNVVKATFRNRQGVTYSQDLPWIAKIDQTCLQTEDNSVAVEENKPGKSDWSDQPIKTQVLENPYGAFGYIEISSFEFTMPAQQVVRKLKSILENDFAHTDGLIIDIRGNGGGDVGIAEGMLQLLTPRRIDPLRFVMKMSGPGAHFIKTVNENDPFNRAIEEAKKRGLPYTSAEPLIAETLSNNIGQSYFKPVAVFTDGYCYSACDMLASQFQDHEIGPVFGEAKSTGGGGANVFRTSKILSLLGNKPGPYRAMPAGQDLIFAFRQTQRTGKNAGKLIEDVGINSDILLPSKTLDMFDGDSGQLTQIGKYLSERSLSYKSSASMSDERLDFVQGTKPTAVVSWENSEKITFSENKKVIAVSKVRSSGKERKLNLRLATQVVRPGRMDLTGSQEGKKVWRKILNYRIVPAGQLLKLPFKASEKDFSFYTVDSEMVDGWIFKNGTLKLAHTTYQDDLLAEASLFIKSSTASSLTFDLDMITEEDCDFLEVVAVVEGEETVLKKLSGEVRDLEEVDLSDFKGKDIEIRFKFTSDELTTFRGVNITNVGIK